MHGGLDCTYVQVKTTDEIGEMTLVGDANYFKGTGAGSNGMLISTGDFYKSDTGAFLTGLASAPYIIPPVPVDDLAYANYAFTTSEYITKIPATDEYITIFYHLTQPGGPRMGLDTNKTRWTITTASGSRWDEGNTTLGGGALGFTFDIINQIV